MSDVRTWLAGIGLGQYADVFEANDVEMDLLSVDDQMLKDIGVTMLTDSRGRLPHQR